MAVGIRCADHVTPLYPQKLALTSPTGGGRSVGIGRSRTKAMEFSFVLVAVNECTVLRRQCGVGRGWYYVTEVTCATQVCYVWYYPISSTVQHPSRTGALCLRAHPVLKT
jgi:hypothetical protein